MSTKDDNDVNAMMIEDNRSSTLQPDPCLWCHLIDTGLCPHAGEKKAEDFDASQCPDFKAKAIETDEGISFNFGQYVVKTKGGLAIFYYNDEPQYPIKITKLQTISARKSLAKSLGVDIEIIHQVAARLLLKEQPTVEPDLLVKKDSSTSSEAEVRALEILTSEKPLEFIADTIQKIHVGDRDKSKLIWLTTVTPGLGYELNIMMVGMTGIGKSDLVYVVLCCVPDEFVIRLKECSPKSIYYAVKAGVEIEKAVLYFDDVPNKPDTVKTLKDITSENRSNPRLWSVTKDREHIDVALPGSFVVLASAVTNLTDEGGQINRRYIVLNPEENLEANKPIINHIKEEMRSGRGKRYLPAEFEVAKELTRMIREEEVKVLIPFDFEYPDYGTEARSELKQFCALIWSVARVMFKQRLIIDGYVLAERMDFDEARRLWGLRQGLKLDETARKVLEHLRKEEPKQIHNEDGGFQFSTDPVTSTMIATELKERPKLVQDKLKHLYDMGYVDRKPIGGRGNPYAYWKSPAYLRFQGMRQSSCSIKLKHPNMSSDDLYAFLRNSIGEKNAITAKTLSSYLSRYNEQARLLSPEITRKSSKDIMLSFEQKDEYISRFPKTRKTIGSIIKNTTIKNVSNPFPRSKNNLDQFFRKNRSRFPDLTSSSEKTDLILSGRATSKILTSNDVNDIGELISTLRLKWNTGYRTDFIDQAIEGNSISKEEAKQLFDKLINDGRILRNPEGLWKWT